MTQTPPDNDPTPEQLLECDAAFATMTFRQTGKLPPRIYAVTADNQLLFLPYNPPDSRRDQDVMFLAMQMAFVAYDVVRYTCMSEAWMAPHDDDSQRRMPSQRPDREEALVIAVRSRETHMMRVFRIQRDRRGRVRDLVQDERVRDETDFVGWLTELLPPTRPTPAERRLAQSMLPSLGLKIVMKPYRYRPETRH